MDFQNIQSFEQRSTFAFDGTLGNRVIIANRREPDAYWCKCYSASRSEALSEVCRFKSWLSSVYNWLCCCFRDGISKCNGGSLFGPFSINGSNTDRRRNQIDQQQQQSGATESALYDTGPFASNKLITSKYTMWNFLPKNLYEQFRRLANFYFLTTAMIQIILPFSPVGPATSLIPLSFVVITSAVKQAYEDYLRHRSDQHVNNKLCGVLKNKKLHRVRSRDIRVGDIVHVKNNEEIPCDMIMLASSCASALGGLGKTASPDGIAGASTQSGVGGDRCHITTANLDGETSLKSRSCFAIRQQIGSIKEIDNTLLVVECEKPNATLFEFNGFLRAPRDSVSYERLVRELNSELNAAARLSRPVNKQQRGPTTCASEPSETKLQSNLVEQSGMAASSTLADHSGPVSSSDLSRRQSIIQSIYRRIRKSRKSRYASRLAKINAQQLKSLGADHIIKGVEVQDLAHDETLDHVEIPLDIANLLPRGARLRNTAFVYGLVVYTGRDTRLAHNSHVKSNKFSSLESRVNMYLIISFAVLITFTIVSSLRFEQLPGGFKGRKHLNPIEILFAHFVLYNYLLPISLYVNLEFIKFFGTLSVLRDKHLQAPAETNVETVKISPNQQPLAISLKATASPQLNRQQTSAHRPVKKQVPTVGAQCNSSDLNEELGQVEVLFSDKTGTLTENKMHFMACSLDSTMYRLVGDRLYEQPAGLCHVSVVPVARKLASITSNRYAVLGVHLRAQTASSKSTIGTQSGLSANRSSMSSDRFSLLPPEQRPFDHRIVPPMSQLKLVDNLDQNQRVAEFFICLCLCSTIALNEQLELSECLPDKMGSYDLQAASPDEESLISAATTFGIVMCKSNDRECYIAIKRSDQNKRSPSSKAKPPASPSRQQTEERSLSPQQARTQSPSNDPSQSGGIFKPVVETNHSTSSYIVRKFERLLTLEFTSARKKMSVIVRDCDNDCLLMVTKGSENVLDCINLLGVSVATERLVDTTLAHFEAFSKSGLRTMLLARRQVAVQELEQIVDEQRQARLMSVASDREQQLMAISKQVESNMQLVGATAVEDTLQDGVPETIAHLKSAGIKVWLLTGDKVETAISVAYLCKLLDRGMQQFHLVRQRDSHACRELLLDYHRQLLAIFGTSEAASSVSGQQTGPLNWIKKFICNDSTTVPELVGDDESCRFALVADGRSLHYAMKYSRKELAYICKHCICVLGCRLSPLQKAEIVDMIKQGEEKPICAAIGDGANDVSMIQEAHVGIGISGKEGRQAVNSSDFAINRFHMLRRLVFVHGHLFYHRTANTIVYFFYKNMIFVFPQFLYSLHWSNDASSLYHPIMLVAYNLLFTSAPILFYGLTEVDVPTELLEKYPKFYTINRRNRRMRYVVYLNWITVGALQASIAFYFLYGAYGRNPYSASVSVDKESNKFGFATTLFFALIYTVIIKLILISKNPGFIFYMTALLVCSLVPITYYLMSLIDMSSFFDDNSLYRGFYPMAITRSFWTAVGWTLCVSLVPDVIQFVIERLRYNRTVKAIIQTNTK